MGYFEKYIYRRLILSRNKNETSSIHLIIDDNLKHYWVKFIKDHTKNSFPSLGIRFNSIREKEIDSDLSYIQTDDEMRNKINSFWQ